jgi:anti-sigma-K factor RskA
MESPLTDTRPKFSRLTSGSSTSAWRAAIPAVVVIVALVGLLGYLASSVSTYSQKAMTAQREAEDARQQTATMSKQVGSMQADLSLARDPGRTTVVLAPAAADKPESKKKGAADKASAPPADAAWAAVTWGEAAGGKTWMRVNAYGLSKLENGQAVHAWMTPATGDPVDLGALDVDQNGSAYLQALNLPTIDQGKSVALSLDDSGAKLPGKILAKADLPKLKSTATAIPGAAPAQAPAAPAVPQAKSGETTKAMHEQGK